MAGGIVDAHAPQGADHDFVVLRQAQAGDFVVGEGVRVGVGMPVAGALAGCEVHAIQPVHGPDPYFIPRAQECGGAVVFADEQVGQDFGLGKTFAFDRADLVEAAAQGDPHGSVQFYIACLGHQVVVGNVTLQGIDQETAAVVRESDAEELVAGGEPDAAFFIPPERCRRMCAAPRPGHAGKVVQRREAFHVHDLQHGARNPEPAVVVLAAVADDVADGPRARFAGKRQEGISVVPDETTSEGADPRVSAFIETDSVDVLVRQPVLAREPVYDHVILGLCLGVEPAWQGQCDKHCQNKIHPP